MLQYLLLISDEKDSSLIKCIFEKYHNDMIRFAMSRLKKAGFPNSFSDAEDAVQNAFVKITKYVSKIKVNASDKELKAYILTIVANETKNIIENMRDVEELVDDMAELDENEFFERLRIRDRYETVIETMEGLDEKYSVTLLYYYQKEMKVKDIAALMGISEKTVYTRLQRGKKLLLQSLGEEKS